MWAVIRASYVALLFCPTVCSVHCYSCCFYIYSTQINDDDDDELQANELRKVKGRLWALAWYSGLREQLYNNRKFRRYTSQDR